MTHTTLEYLVAVWECTYIDYYPPILSVGGGAAVHRPEKIAAEEDLDDGLKDLIERHDDNAEKAMFPDLSIPSWFDQPQGRQTVKFECNGVNRMLYQRRFSTTDDIARKVSQLGNRIFYDDPLHRELLFGE